MFEGFRERFDAQKSDDIFVEAAINPNARQEYIDKLVSSRTKMTRISILMVLVFAFHVVIELFMPLLTPRAPYSQTILIINLVTLGLVTASFSAAIVSNDLAIKFLKALEAGAK